MRSFQTPDTPFTSARPPSLPSVPTSRATRVTSSANAESWSTIVLRVSLSSRISPWASTVIFLDRSPFATAVETTAICRTCEVRLLAMKLTLSVRSFQTPDTPRTCAWPPSLPSVPTSRATRVTSSANAESWSTIVLTVCFSSSISPTASTVTLRLRSPRATPVVTSAMSRTCAETRSDIVFTASVRSRQLPDMPRRLARPPSLPSVPRSRVTRVTSEVNSESWSTMPLMALPSRRTSPRAARSRSIRRDRSPLATASMTSAAPLTGVTMASIRSLTEPTLSAHAPTPGPGLSRSVKRPSLTISRRTRASSLARCSRRSATSFSSSLISLRTPGGAWDTRRRKSPSRHVMSVSRKGTRSDSR